MPECTEAERAYLEACLQAGANPGRGLLDAIAAERLTPELRETVIRTEMARIVAYRANEEAWVRIDAAGAHDSTRRRLETDIRNEAERRLDAPTDPEPIEPASTGRLRQ
jgi:hypothetical protein